MLRRSTRAGQGGRGYDPAQRNLFAHKDVKPREWHFVTVTMGYFKVKRWQPKSQEHLTPELHEDKEAAENAADKAPKRPVRPARLKNVKTEGKRIAEAAGLPVREGRERGKRIRPEDEEWGT